MATEYKKDLELWTSGLICNYGLSKENGNITTKTEDRLEFNTSYGLRKNNTTKWYYMAKFSFKTQFSNGYAYPDVDNAISGFFAPAYLFLGLGTEYTNEEKKFRMYFSPITEKATIVTNNKLSEIGAFGVSPGKNHRTEFGILLNANTENTIMENVTMKNEIYLYTDYINNFGNIEIDWKLDILFEINKYIKASIHTNIVYNDNVNNIEIDSAGETVETGPRLQMKQLIGIGLSYNF